MTIVFATMVSWPGKKGDKTLDARKGEWFLCLAVKGSVVEAYLDMDALEQDRIEHELRQDVALVRASGERPAP